MRSRLIYILLLLLAIAVVAMAIGLYFSNQNTPPPITPPVFSPPPQSSPSTPKVDKPAYTASDVEAFARQQPEIQALYAVAERTKNYAYPEVIDFKWAEEYQGNGRWLIGFMYTQWDYNINGYVARSRYWFFDEAKTALTPAN